jgi:hypothetical protein
MRLPKTLIALVVTASLTPVGVRANSHVLNTTKSEVWVYWQAAGCAGVKSLPSCATEKNAFTVCKKTVLQPGEIDDYNYPDGTSGRRVLASMCYSNGKIEDFNDAQTGNKGEKKRCALLREGAEALKVKCGYTQSEYDALKSP